MLDMPVEQGHQKQVSYSDEPSHFHTFDIFMLPSDVTARPHICIANGPGSRGSRPRQGSGVGPVVDGILRMAGFRMKR